VHESVELALGTGIIGQAQLGFGRAVAASALFDGGWIAAARLRRPPSRLLAFLAGVAVGVPIVHYTLWPWTAAGGVPRLVEAEGLPVDAMPLYNAVLYAWALSGVAALAVETPRRHRRWAVAGFAAVAAFRPVAQHHFRWIAAEAEVNPAWWNRAWAR
jgi:hypothetical protein